MVTHLTQVYTIMTSCPYPDSPSSWPNEQSPIKVGTNTAIWIKPIAGRGTDQLDYTNEYYLVVIDANTETVLEAMAKAIMGYSSRNQGFGYAPSGTTGYPYWIELSPANGIRWNLIFRRAFILEARWK